MFAGQREFRSVVFSCSLKSITEITKLLPRQDVSQQLESVPTDSPSAEVFHGYYYSTTPFTDPAKIEGIRVPYFGIAKYRYDFYACESRRGRHTQIAIAVPFAEMGLELFKKVDDVIRRYKRRYVRVDLPKLGKLLEPGGALAEIFSASSAKFRLDGGDTVRAVEMTGPDVFASEFYQRTVANLQGLELVPRRLRLKFSGTGSRISFDADTHGNFGVRVAKDGHNLSSLANALDALEKSGATQPTADYPLRRGIAGDDDGAE